MIVIAGLLIAFVLILIFANRKTRHCRWREDRARDREGQRKYQCMTCGAVAFTSNGKPPLHCLATKPPK